MRILLRDHRSIEERCEVQISQSVCVFGINSLELAVKAIIRHFKCQSAAQSEPPKRIGDIPFKVVRLQ